MGAVLSAVSPAVVVPRMLRLMDEKYGADKSIPKLIMAGASCDDIFVIVLFSTFISMAQGRKANLLDFANIPISILLGVTIGAVFGFVLSLFFETAYAHKHIIRNSMKVIVRERDSVARLDAVWSEPVKNVRRTFLTGSVRILSNAKIKNHAKKHGFLFCERSYILIEFH